jgi:hypothetical protein
VNFDIKDIVVTSNEYAFARTSSAGTQKVVQIGETSQEANQELFVLQKVGGEWKIARCCFNSMNPASEYNMRAFPPKQGVSNY